MSCKNSFKELFSGEHSSLSSAKLVMINGRAKNGLFFATSTRGQFFFYLSFWEKNSGPHSDCKIKCNHLVKLIALLVLVIASIMSLIGGQNDATLRVN